MSGWSSGVIALFVVLAAAALFPGCGEKDDPALIGREGYDVYKQYCRRCHGNRGDAARATRMAERTIDLLAPAYRDTVTHADMLQVVREGRGRMKGYAAKLTESELETVTRFVWDLPELLAGAPDP